VVFVAWFIFTAGWTIYLVVQFISKAHQNAMRGHFTGNNPLNKFFKWLYTNDRR